MKVGYSNWKSYLMNNPDRAIYDEEAGALENQQSTTSDFFLKTNPLFVSQEVLTRRQSIPPFSHIEKCIYPKFRHRMIYTQWLWREIIYSQNSPKITLQIRQKRRKTTII